MAKFTDYSTIKIEIDNRIARIFLNRPEVHNAFNNHLINDLYDVFNKLKNENEIRIIILTGLGKSFCAGADLNWMKSVINYSYEQNLEESLKLANLMYLVFTHPKPVIARINGSAIGGGVGLMSVCDILIADENAIFGLSEVKLGLVPAAISPFVMCRIGEPRARELFITGERITAKKAEKLNLINYAVPTNKLDETVNEKVNLILQNGPEAIRVVKEMIFNVGHKIDISEVHNYTAKLIANLRLSPEGQEGMNAFLEKRKPNWVNNKI
ncbi:enoyl-CoA hydratase/isomerase family protein [Bacteroidetes/Chlorobi group bacterium ChocPot_Mid]|jgi:methylglutaconyl-CoA hydratase|nr:MAG: enoyl-CoA hydratase/isomerase family protein [Bacteroidetes/Chlorobi group bacterium ChocPot_Mid]